MPASSLLSHLAAMTTARQILPPHGTAWTMEAMLRSLSALLPCALLVAGCGATEIDSGRAQDFVKRAFGAPTRSVRCPSGVEAKPGRALTCRVVAADGRHYDVVLHIADDNGRVKVGAGDVRPVP
jgi:uncharacterized protein DUF4333